MSGWRHTMFYNKNPSYKIDINNNNVSLEMPNNDTLKKEVTHWSCPFILQIGITQTTTEPKLSDLVEKSGVLLHNGYKIEMHSSIFVFYVIFSNFIAVILWRIARRAEENSMYSWLMFCSLNHQLSNLRFGPGCKLQSHRWEASMLLLLLLRHDCW